jgi:antitoxin ParD1/3/4
MFRAYLEHDISEYILFSLTWWLPRGRKLMKLITLYLPEPYIKMLDQLVNERFYPNRAEAIRVAIRDLINDEFVRRKNVG